jgi:trigger factor
MADAVQTTVTELPRSRVRVDVQVAPEELERELQRTATQLGREMKLPGFRKGKVPAPLVLQRVGRDAVLDEVVRDGLAGWYAGAIDEAKIVPVGDPKIDLAGLPAQGDALRFSIEIGVLPKAELGEYAGLEVARREPAVADEQVAAQLEQIRERLARLETVERPAAKGDFVVVDYVGSLLADDGERDGEGSEHATRPFAGGEGRDQLVELGSGKLIPGFEEALLGARAGDARTVELTFPPDYGVDGLAGRAASFAVTVKDVKAKQLPALDDDLAVDAGFDDLGALRRDVHARLLDEDGRRVRDEFAGAALDAAVERATVPLTPELIKARAREMWERAVHSLAHRGVSREAYLKVIDRAEEDVLAELEPDAERTLRREAVLSAVAAAERIDPSEEEIERSLAPAAESEGAEPAQLLARVRAAGRVDELRESLAARQAAELIADRATPVEPERARAKQKLWMPGKESDEEHVATAAGRLWTPDR